jgi:hypothetical protein
MTLPAEMYRLNAAECERECARATTPVLKRKYRDLAQQWRDMAEQADRAVVKKLSDQNDRFPNSGVSAIRTA